VDALEYASADLRADREFVLAAVAQNGHALKYVSVDLRADREVVVTAVAQNGIAVGYVSAKLQADPENPEVVLALISFCMWSDE
jgi:hypothetical protein